MRSISKARAAIIARMKPARDAYREQAGSCMYCGHKRPLDIHEIARGQHRMQAYQEPCAWLALCRPCHQVIQDWPIVQQLALKAVSDPTNYDRSRVNELRGRAPDAISEHEVVQEIARLACSNWRELLNRVT